MSLNLTKHGYTKLHSYLSTLLRSGTHEIVFQKANGDIRVLQGTLDSAVLTEELGSECYGYKPTSRTSVESISVFDKTSSGWRSFKLDNLIGIDGININTLLKHAQINLEEETI
ncbi:hypothetical protein KARL1_72 [Acinetobacter phage KARL-1]|uniref:Uncharacterized protein n=1 Tax=Acinetobacter phage KARL-1 TaxID=2301662 RepID=A0A385IIH4_9CAUD|nr:hypothetical protein HYP70_gp072 [Acinetobacter phage KARL-1]AXY82691.1 hypothetical protein KARL1_72 [Acinetobacter phage KARL-1]